MGKTRKGRQLPKQPAAPPAASDAVAPSNARRWAAIIALVAVVAGLAFGVYRFRSAQPTVDIPVATEVAEIPATFVGAETCAGCHAAEAEQWRGSQHARAMQHASEATVLGDFADAKFSYNGVESTFFRRDGKYFVNTDGPGGQLGEFEVQYTFGVYPLQQYLIAFPDGRVQALSIAWDARPQAEGGGRWYHLYPDEKITHDDPLHWTQGQQNWNWMCADCHTTNLDRNYDAATDRYATTWSEMNVACEACHGPGARHVAWAGNPDDRSPVADYGLVVQLDGRRGATWPIDPATGNAHRSKPLERHQEMGVCAQCHSRRAPFAEGMDHDGRFLDTHDLSLLTDPLYFPDGQQRDEVFDTGSFLQSKMHSKGVTCSDCHNPHSGELRLPGNAVCGQCHSAAKFDQPTHTLHATGSTGAVCASCHMPPRTFMGVDDRHDHSIRIPRPDLAASLGAPDACTSCHTDRDAAWAASAIENAFGPDRKGFQTFAPMLHAARSGAPGAARGLLAVIDDPAAPAIARATALVELGPYLNSAVMPVLEKALADPEPMVRAAALETLLAAPPPERMRLAMPLVTDSSRMVRIKAARALAIAPREGLDATTRTNLEKAFGEYVSSQEANSDRPEAHINLGLFHSERQDPVRAEADYRAALKLSPKQAPAYLNLADLYRMYNREPDAEAVLLDGLAAVPADADLTHSLGLLRVRQQRIAEALPLLEEAARNAPLNPRYAYVYGVALHSSGKKAAGIAVMEDALKRFPANPELLYALAGYARDAGDLRKAQVYADRLRELAPDTDNARQPTGSSQ